MCIHSSVFIVRTAWINKYENKWNTSSNVFPASQTKWPISVADLWYFVLNSFLSCLLPEAEAFAASLSDVLRLAEAILCRLTGDTWQNQSLLGTCDSREREQHSGFIHGDVNTSSTQVQPWNVPKRVGIKSYIKHFFGLLTVLTSDCD